MLSLAISLCVLVTLISALRVERDDLWTSFKVRYNKTYDRRSDAFRREIWELNMDKIERHNIEESRGLHSYTMGENHFSDMTHEELEEGKMMRQSVAMTHGFRSRSSISEFSGREYVPPTNVTHNLSSHVDWRKQGIVTSVKDQGNCGSCWAFATAAAVESHWAKKHGELMDLSEQNLVDCAGSTCAHGCKCGTEESALNYILENGINTEASYPYSVNNFLQRHPIPSTCKYQNASVAARISTYWYGGVLPEEDVAYVVEQFGPVTSWMAIPRGSEDKPDYSFDYYKHGIYKSDKPCSIGSEDTGLHAMLIVGFGTSNQGDYWIVKNSWGADWGEGGYGKVARNADHMCGIATMWYYPEI